MSVDFAEFSRGGNRTDIKSIFVISLFNTKRTTFLDNVLFCLLVPHHKTPYKKTRHFLHTNAIVPTQQSSTNATTFVACCTRGLVTPSSLLSCCSVLSVTMRCKGCGQLECVLEAHRDLLLGELLTLDSSLNESKRRNHLYRSFVSAEYGPLGHHNRVKIPDCVVDYI